jgi:addiction module RelE/StbE family toxin
MQIIYTPKFRREYKHLPLHIKEIAEAKENIFRENPFHHALKTHKLKGKFQEFWSFSLSYQYRIVFEFSKNNIVYFHSVGTHHVYQ